MSLLQALAGFLKSILSMSEMSRRILFAYCASSSTSGSIGLFMFTAYPISRMTFMDELELIELMKITAWDTSMASTISSL